MSSGEYYIPQWAKPLKVTVELAIGTRIEKEYLINPSLTKKEIEKELWINLSADHFLDDWVVTLKWEWVEE